MSARCSTSWCAGYSVQAIARSGNLTDDEASSTVESVLTRLHVPSVASAVELARVISWRGAFHDDSSSDASTG